MPRWLASAYIAIIRNAIESYDNHSRGEFDKPRLALDARIDDIDIDRYLPPPTPAKDKAAAPASKPPASTGDKQAIDYAPLRRLVLDARLNAAKIKVNQARLQNIVLKITGRNGRFQLEPFSADLYGGRARIAGARSSGKVRAERTARRGVPRGD